VTFSTMEEAVTAIAAGGMAIVVDDADRENEGDLVMAAQFVSAEAIAFFLAHTSGVICVPMLDERADELELPLMVSTNTESQRTAFTISVDARRGTTSGISAGDRAATIRALIDPATRPRDLSRPGHVFPLRYRPGGVFRRQGHTEATVDLVKLAGMYPAGVLCEVVSPDKASMARLPELTALAAEHGLPLVSIADLVRYRCKREKLVERTAGPARIPTRYGDFIGYAFRSMLDGEEHLALVFGNVSGERDVLVRVHSECLTGDVFGSLGCDCGPHLHEAMRLIAEAGCGVVVYLRGQEDRGIALAHKRQAYHLQERVRETVETNMELGPPVDSCEYSICAQILVDLGVGRMRLMTNNLTKYGGFEGFGLDLVERVPLSTLGNPQNIHSLGTKQAQAFSSGGSCRGQVGASTW